MSPDLATMTDRFDLDRNHISGRGEHSTNCMEHGLRRRFTKNDPATLSLGFRSGSSSSPSGPLSVNLELLGNDRISFSNIHLDTSLLASEDRLSEENLSHDVCPKNEVRNFMPRSFTNEPGGPTFRGRSINHFQSLQGSRTEFKSLISSEEALHCLDEHYAAGLRICKSSASSRRAVLVSGPQLQLQAVQGPPTVAKDTRSSNQLGRYFSVPYAALLRPASCRSNPHVASLVDTSFITSNGSVKFEKKDTDVVCIEDIIIKDLQRKAHSGHLHSLYQQVALKNALNSRAAQNKVSASKFFEKKASRKKAPQPAKEHAKTFIPSSWLQKSISLKQISQFRSSVFESGTAADKLAFKILYQVILSPVFGISQHALPLISDALSTLPQVVTSEDSVHIPVAAFPSQLNELMTKPISDLFEMRAIESTDGQINPPTVIEADSSQSVTKLPIAREHNLGKKSMNEISATEEKPMENHKSADSSIIAIDLLADNIKYCFENVVANFPVSGGEGLHRTMPMVRGRPSASHGADARFEKSSELESADFVCADPLYQRIIYWMHSNGDHLHDENR